MANKEDAKLLVGPAKGKSYTEPNDSQELSESSEEQGLALKRNITLGHAVGIIICSVIGSGIFITPQSVFTYSGSIGASLLLWGFTGFYTSLLSWCYMELATTIPLSGGEYTFAYVMCGEMQGFLIGWINLFVSFPAAAGAIAQTAALYIATSVGLSDSQPLKLLLALLCICMLSQIIF